MGNSQKKRWNLKKNANPEEKKIVTEKSMIARSLIRLLYS